MTDNTMIAKADALAQLEDSKSAIMDPLTALHDKIDNCFSRGDSGDGDELLDAANALHAQLNTEYQTGKALFTMQGGAQTDDDGEKPPPHP